MSTDEVRRDLRYLLDLEALRALGQRYARAADERDYAAMADLFWPDAVVDGLRGSTPIDEYVANLANTPPAFESSMHVLADPLIDLTPGHDTARLDTYAVVHQLDRDGASGMTLGMRYRDDVERRDGVWRIRHRRAELRWMTR